MKEIERKWVANLTDELRAFLLNEGAIEIKDYYFNDYTRLRNYNNKWFITVKSLGNEIRDEYEFEIDKSQIDFIPTPSLVKKRSFYEYKGHTFEINIFRDLSMMIGDKSATNLILVECELSNPNEEIDLPEFIGKEVTFDSAYYGRALFQRIKLNRKEPFNVGEFSQV